jgi:hypothetical protein
MARMLKNYKWRPFAEARKYARSLGLKKREEWVEFCKSGRKPNDIPGSPAKVYKDSGWSGWGDWLGTGYVASPKRKYRSFEEAREYARSLGLSWWREWTEHAKSCALPPDIPREPRAVYKDSGWVSVGDWLGTGNVATYKRKYRSFEEAREYARSLGLKSQTEWVAWRQTDARPPDIPTNPHTIYTDEWVGYWDWLGTGNRRGGWRSFEEAREYVRGLGLKDKAEWSEYVESGAKPDDIPAAPRSVYEEEWQGIRDWLGTEDVPGRVYRSFEEAQEYGRSLGIKTGEEWYRWSASGQKPLDIPSRPDHIYPDEWRGWGDFLGTGNVLSKQWRPFEDARAYVRSLGLKNTDEWREYCRSGNKPDDIPSNPNVVYGDKWKRR